MKPTKSFVRPDTATFNHFIDLAADACEPHVVRPHIKLNTLAHAIADNVPGCDKTAIAGAIEFMRLCHDYPASARLLLENYHE